MVTKALLSVVEKKARMRREVARDGLRNIAVRMQTLRRRLFDAESGTSFLRRLADGGGQCAPEGPLGTDDFRRWKRRAAYCAWCGAAARTNENIARTLFAQVCAEQRRFAERLAALKALDERGQCLKDALKKRLRLESVLKDLRQDEESHAA